MADELVLYTNPMSRGRIVRWMLEEVGQPYKAEIIEYASMKSPEYLAINPMGKVPAVRHGETIVTEGAAICAYLADVFPEAGLAPPPGSRLRERRPRRCRSRTPAPRRSPAPPCLPVALIVSSSAS